MLVSLTRVIKFAFRNFWRNIWLSVATISVIILTLISVSFLSFLNVLTLEAVEQVKDKIDISVYFKPEVTPQEVKTIRTKLLRLSNIQSIQYISREDSLKFLKESYQEDLRFQQSIKELGSNPLGDTLVIKAHELKFYPLILEALEQSQYKGLIQNKNYKDNQAFLNRINIVTEKITKIGWIISAVFAAIAILIVFNTIRIAIYTHSEEIGIMKLVGSDNWFIRAPFLVEAVLYAGIGTILATTILFPLIKIINPYILSFFEGSFSLMAYYTSHMIMFSWWHFLGVLALSLISSFIAVGRYLDV